jgi:hypothetical protein
MKTIVITDVADGMGLIERMALAEPKDQGNPQ